MIIMELLTLTMTMNSQCYHIHSNMGTDKHYYVNYSTLWNDTVTTPSPLSLKLTPYAGHDRRGRLLHLSIVIVSFLSPKGGSLRKMAPKVGILRGARKSPVTDMSLLGV